VIELDPDFISSDGIICPRCGAIFTGTGMIPPIPCPKCQWGGILIYAEMINLIMLEVPRLIDPGNCRWYIDKIEYRYKQEFNHASQMHGSWKSVPPSEKARIIYRRYE